MYLGKTGRIDSSYDRGRAVLTKERIRKLRVLYIVNASLHAAIRMATESGGLVINTHGTMNTVPPVRTRTEDRMIDGYRHCMCSDRYLVSSRSGRPAAT